jgi:hypothetical protein
MKVGSLEMKKLARPPKALFTGTQGPEIFRRLGDHIAVESAYESGWKREDETH